jgi:hypothetical protein
MSPAHTGENMLLMRTITIEIEKIRRIDEPNIPLCFPSSNEIFLRERFLCLTLR